jgi:ADP-ribose pyrophosphatase
METRESPRHFPDRLSTRMVHDGRIVKLSLDTVRYPDGSQGTLEMIRHPGASAVLPVVGSVDEPDPEILLIHQYRYAAGGYIWEIPAGIPLSPDEPGDVCARRELEEETGHRAGELWPLTRILTTPGFTDEAIQLFLASGLTKGERNLDDDEFVEVVKMPFSRALEMVRSGEITDSKSVCTILYAAAFVMGMQEAS